MFELNETQLHNLIKCSQCNSIKNDEPKLMPCGANICPKCCEIQHNDTFECNYCKLNHSKKNLFPNNSLKQLYQLYEQNKSKKEKQRESISEPVKLVEKTQIKIENQYKKVEDEIVSSVEKLLNEIDVLKKKLICEVHRAKQESLLNFDEKFYKLSSDELIE